MATADQLTQAKNNALYNTSDMTNVRNQTPTNFQNTNNAALANTSYDKLNLQDISGSYKNQLNNALSNTNTAYYQNNVQNALNNYNNAMALATTPQNSTTFKNDMTNSINNLYNTQKNNVPLYYQTGIDQAKQNYAGLENQASVTNQQNLNKLKESIASQGLFNSGDNITSQTGINNQYANDLSGYKKQEQNYYDTTNNAIAQQKANYDAQTAQALIDLGYKADTRDFNLADLQDNRNQQKFNNAMSANTSQYGMSQDQYNNTLKAIGQQYGMDQNQVQNLLNYAQYNSSENQRQYQNSTGTNNANYNMYNDNVKNDQSQQQINLSDRNAQWQNSQWAQQFLQNNSQWQQEFDYKKQQDAIANQLAAARAASSGRSSGGSKSSGSSSNSKYAQYADDAAALKAMGYNSSFINASMPTWNYEASPYYIYSGSR